MKLELDVALGAPILFHVGSLPVSSTMIWQVLIAAWLVWFFVKLLRNWQDIPSRLQAAVELLVEAGVHTLTDIIGHKGRAQQIFPFAMTIFVYVMICNLLPVILPVNAFSVPASDGSMTALIRSPMADYNQTLIFALISVTIMQFSFIMVNGLRAYVGKFFNFAGPIDFFLGLMDIVGEIAKILSLSFRLFGNIFAGEVLTMIILLLLPFALPLPFVFLGVFTAVIQAFVFALLSAVFIGQALTPLQSESKSAS